MSDSIKIYLSYHKDSHRIRSDILTPIHVGRAIASEETIEKLSDMIGDDTGNNISDRNASFCELTAQYWAWKNTDDQYVGFFHYRRHLCFNPDNKTEENKWGIIEYPYITEDYLDRAGLRDEFISNAVKGRNLISVTPWNVEAAGSVNNRDHYARSSPYLHISDFDRAMKILAKNYPDYEKDIESYCNSNYGYYTNIFVMKRSLFNEYCELLFGTLFELESELDISDYNVQEKRIFGYISEWIFGVFLTHYNRISGETAPCHSRTYIQNTELEGGWYDVLSASDDNYARHLGVLITSISNNMGKEKIRYWILSNDIDKRNRQLLEGMSNNKLKIVLVDADDTNFNFARKSLRTNAHVSLSTYLRLFICRYVPQDIHKILYLDCDMVCKGSLMELLEMPFDGNSIFGVEDILSKENKSRLGVEKYINAGMLLIDLKKWREGNYQNLLYQYVVRNYGNSALLFYHDQDTINSVLNNSIGYVDSKWNAQTSSYSTKEQERMNKIGKTAVIIHFISDRKPWKQGAKSPFFNDYAHYFKMGPWSDEPIICARVSRDPKYWIYKKLTGAGDKMAKDEHLCRLSELIYAFTYKMGYEADLIKLFELHFMHSWVPSNHIIGAMNNAASNGNTEAMLRMARFYKDAHGVDRNLLESFRWFMRTIDAGAGWAESELHTILPDVYDLTYSTEGLDLAAEAFKYITRMAESTGSVHATVRVARAYKDAHGVELNRRASYEWFKKTIVTGANWARDEMNANFPEDELA